MNGQALSNTACEQDEPRVGWTAFAPLAMVLFLLWLATRRSWGEQGQDVPYLGAVVVLLGLLPALFWKHGRHAAPERVGTIPFLPTLGVLYALYFGLPTLIDDRFNVVTLQLENPNVVKALQLAIVGWIALLIGWRLGRQVFDFVKPLRLELDWGRARRALPALLAIGFLAILAQRVLPLPGGLMQPVRFLQTFFQIGVGLLALLSFRGELTRRENLFLWLGMIPSYLFLQVGHGSVAQLAYAGVFLLFIAWGAGHRVPLVALGIGAVAILLMRGHVHSFRSAAWDDQGVKAEAGVWERSVYFVELLAVRLTEDTSGTFEEAFEEVSARVAHLGTFSHVVHLTPERVPYWGGVTYAALPSTVVPRILWPNKPSKEIGQAFGHRYELLAPMDRTTAVNLPILVEFYANFGLRGVLFGMGLLGMLYQLLHRWWNHPAAGPGTLILASILFSRLILIESDFTLVFGALIQTSVLLILVIRWLGPRAELRRPVLVEGRP